MFIRVHKLPEYVLNINNATGTHVYWRYLHFLWFTYFAITLREKEEICWILKYVLWVKLQLMSRSLPQDRSIITLYLFYNLILLKVLICIQFMCYNINLKILKVKLLINWLDCQFYIVRLDLCITQGNSVFALAW